MHATRPTGAAALRELRELRESGELFRLFVENVRDYALITLSPTGEILTWNAGAERIKGYTASEIVGRHFSLFYEDEDRSSALFERLLEAAERDGRVEDEGWRLRKDGTRFWANVVITALRDPNGRLIGYGKMTRDLTGPRDAREQLRQSEERLRAIVDSIRDYAVFMLSTEGEIVTWNTGAQRIKGYSASEIIGRHFSTFYPREDVEAGKCEWELAIAAREGRFEDEGFRVRRDGTLFWANVVISAVHDAQGHLIGFSKVTRDLTERKAAEDERLRLAHAEEAVRLRDEFLSIASHELKTPLTALRLQLQSLATRALDDKSKQKVERASRSADRLGALIETLLDVSRISTGKLSLRPEPAELHALVADVCDRLQDQAASAGVALTFDGAPVEGTWDRLRIEQVVANLVTNAIRYGGGAPVHVSVGPAGELVRIVVRDRGPGIAATDRARIFQRFERASSFRHHGGLGLGLYVSRQIALAHGGEIRLDEPAGGGAQFTVELPRTAPERPSQITG